MNKEVQVYLPSYSPQNEYLSIRYDLVTAIIYSFMYIKGDGSLIPEINYNPSNLISYAHSKNVKVILSVQDYTQIDADTLLSTPTSRTTAINNIYNEVISKGFDGVDTDIEKATHNTSNKANLTAFQSELSTKLWTSNPNYRLSIAIGSYYPDTDLLFDVNTLQNYCNYIMIMGYDWYGSWSSTSGPNSPHILDSGIGNYPTIQHYTSLMDKSKLLFGVPYYGKEYQTLDDTRLSNRIVGSNVTNISYKQYIDTIIPSLGNKTFDSVWKTPWFIQTKYTMDVGITIFGSSPNFPVDDIIDEWKIFIESWSNIKLNLIINKYPQLPDSDINFSGTPPCYFINPYSLSADTISKIPTNVQSNIILYYYNGLTPICYLGGTWYVTNINNLPLSAIPFGEYLIQNDFPPWTNHTSQVMMHEWLLGLDSIFIKLGYPEFPTSEECNLHGFTIENGWQDCYKYYFSLITQQMYQALSNNNPIPEITHWQKHYDDTQSLAQKYDVVNTEGLGGIGIWEISQGTNKIELWDLINQKFQCTPTICSFIIS